MSGYYVLITPSDLEKILEEVDRELGEVMEESRQEKELLENGWQRVYSRGSKEPGWIPPGYPMSLKEVCKKLDSDALARMH